MSRPQDFLKGCRFDGKLYTISLNFILIDCLWPIMLGRVYIQVWNLDFLSNSCKHTSVFDVSDDFKNLSCPQDT